MNSKILLLIILIIGITTVSIIIGNSTKNEKTFNLRIDFQKSIPRELKLTTYDQENQKIYEYTGNKTFFTIKNNENSIKVKVNTNYQKEANIELTQETNQITLENNNYDYLMFVPKETYENELLQKKLTDFEKQKINENYSITTILLSQDYAKEIKENINTIKPKYALLIASEKKLSQQQKTNPLQNSKDPQEFQDVITADWITYSDSEYGVIDSKNEFTPEVIIGRIPFDEPTEITTYFENLKNKNKQTINNIKSEDLKNSYNFLEDSKISPPIRAYDDNFNKISTYDDQIKQLFENQVLYVTLHGSEPETAEQYFVGKPSTQEQDVITFGLESLPEKTSSIIITDACYSGKLDWEKSTTKALLLKGSPAFIGSTTSALAEVAVKPNQQAQSGSNKLLEEIKKNLEQGKTIGESLEAARQTLDYTNEVNQLTSLQFVIYGDPTIKLTN